MDQTSNNFLDAESERDLIARWQQTREESAAAVVINSFTPLINSIVKRYKYYGTSYEDLKQEALLGLCNALDRYDLNRDVRFAGYAKFWIKSHCQDCVMRNWSMVRIGATHVQKKLFFQLSYLKKNLEDLSDQNLPENGIQEIAHALDVSVKDITEIEQRLHLKDYSFDSTINENISSSSFYEITQDPAPAIDEIIISEEEKSAFDELLKRVSEILSTKEWDIVSKRKLSDPPLTLEVISQLYGISKERVRQIELNAIRKLKNKLLKDRLDKLHHH